MQSNHSTDPGNKTEIKGLNISIHEVDTDISEWKLINIHEEIQKDNTIQILIRHIIQGWPESQEKCPDTIKQFYSFWCELSVINGLVFKGTNRIFVPERIRQNTLNNFNVSHLGTSKTILRARFFVIWPGINRDIKQLDFSEKRDEEFLKYLRPVASSSKSLSDAET